MEQVRRIQDATSVRRNLSIGKPLDLVQEFTFTASCKDNVSVGVAEAWQNHTALSVNDFAAARMVSKRVSRAVSVQDGRAISEQVSRIVPVQAVRAVGHWPETGNEPVFDQKPGIVQCSGLRHFLARFAKNLRLGDADDLSYILYESPHSMLASLRINSMLFMMRGCMYVSTSTNGTTLR